MRHQHITQIDALTAHTIHVQQIVCGTTTRPLQSPHTLSPFITHTLSHCTQSTTAHSSAHFLCRLIAHSSRSDCAAWRAESLYTFQESALRSFLPPHSTRYTPATPLTSLRSPLPHSSSDSLSQPTEHTSTIRSVTFDCSAARRPLLVSSASCLSRPAASLSLSRLSVSLS